MSRLLAAAITALALLACTPDGPRFQSADITGASFGRDFALTDSSGKTRRLADFHGMAVVVFFGFTQCPDVCPTAMATLAEAKRKMGPDAMRVQGVFITIDPERDTPELLTRYVAAFDPHFVALRGDAAATERVAKEFKVVYQKAPGSTPETYTMDHSAGLFVFDPQGRLRLFASHGQGADALAHDLRELLRMLE
jgi:protein SCO1/2